VYEEKGRWEDGKILDTLNSLKYSDRNLIQLMISECPHIRSSPERGNYFLRFSSKVIGSLTALAHPHTMNDLKIPKKHFGSRVYVGMK
ncbi:uncharacterized protein TRIVIDRAFT_143709, partial [Trichoderma virens Gv29-8]